MENREAGEAFRAGHLRQAVEAATAAVKAHPMEADARILLAELLVFEGDLERADKQLEAALAAAADSAGKMWVAVFRQLLRGETARRQCHREGRVPELLPDGRGGDLSPDLRARLEALLLLREGKGAEAAEVLARAEEARPRTAGTLEGRPFDDLRDLDDVTASFLEVLTLNGKYYWVPFERLERAEFPRPERPLDLLFRPVKLQVRGGPDGQVYIPALYVESHRSPDERVRLGRMTEWHGEGDNPVRGVGQRLLLAGETEAPFLEVSVLSFGTGS